MKSIDRAARWSRLLTSAGFSIETQAQCICDGEYLLVVARKGNRHIHYTIRTDTKYSRFITGGSSFLGSGSFTRKPSRMAEIIFAEVDHQNYLDRQAMVSA